MINICKHCMDVLGYDNKYTNRTINEDCDKCKRGLAKEDVALVDDLLVPIVEILHKLHGVKTYYSCEGHMVSDVGCKFTNGLSESYIVIDNNPVAMVLINRLIGRHRRSERISYRKDGSSKLRVIFAFPYVKDTYTFAAAKQEMFSEVMKILVHVNISGDEQETLGD